MSDFLSRLVARSSGEQAVVRPRIAPAFAPLAESAAPAPAGALLREAPLAPRAISQLPLDGRPHGGPRYSGVERKPDLSGPAAGGTAFPTRFTHHAPEAHPHRRDIPAEIPDSRMAPARPQEIVLPAADPVRIRPSAREETPPGADQPKGTRDVPALSVQATAATRERAEDVKAVARAAEPAPVPPLVTAVRPAARKADLPLEAARRKPAGEPAIHVTIGRIEVRASIATPKSGGKASPTGGMSLEEYQRLRNRRSTA